MREFKPGRKKRDPAPQNFGLGPPPLSTASDGDEPRCPFVPLGEKNGVYYFLAASGEPRSLAARDLTTNGALSLCGGQPRWLIHAFQKRDNQGQLIDDWSPRAAAAGLMRMCASEGLWDPETPMRGLGVWFDPDVGLLRAGEPNDRAPEPGLVLHVGDALGVIDETGALIFLPSGRRVGRVVYPSQPRISRPLRHEAATGNGRAEAHELRQLLKLWNFRERDRGETLWFGWYCAALLGGAPSWRPHQCVHGARGSGKSTLMRLALAALDAQAKFFDDFSVAGVRNALMNEARAIALDEAEGETDRVVQIIDLLRRMSDGEGASIVRSNAGQSSITSHVTGTAYMTAINPPMLAPQDRSRITELELDPADASNGARVKGAIDWAAKASGVLRERALCGWPRFQRNFAIYRAAILEMECDGARPDGRQADQVGTLLAASDMMLHDEPIDALAARETVDIYRDYIFGIMGQDEEESDARQCFGHLMTSQVESWERGSKLNIGQLLEEAIEPGSAPERQRQTLRIHGMAVIFDQTTQAPILLVANRHGGLARIYRETRWKDGGWKRALGRLRGVEPFDRAVTFAGWQSRCIAIPANHLPTPRPQISNATEPP